MKPFRLIIAGCVVMVASLFAVRLEPTDPMRAAMFACFLGGFACLAVGGANMAKD